MNDLKQIAKEIYAESRKQPTGSHGTRYRKKAVSEYEKEDRYFINAYMERLKKAARHRGIHPTRQYNTRKES